MARKIGDTLKESRINAGMSVEEISDILTKKGYKASIKTIYSWESGNSSPSPDALLDMCDIYKIENILDTFGYNGYKEDGSLQLNIEEIKRIEKYRALDPHGKEMVDFVLDKEAERMEEQSATTPNNIIALDSYKDPSDWLVKYYKSASAGEGVFILGNEAPAKIAISESDWNELADYAISISGTSMEPDYHDGDTVLVSQRVPMHYGDVGIFVIDGNAYIKEYGETELISRNPNAENVTISEFANIVCMGKVIGKVEGKYRVIYD